MNIELGSIDLNDDLTYELLDENHIPDEIVNYDESGKYTHSTIICTCCLQLWPCAIRRWLILFDKMQDYKTEVKSTIDVINEQVQTLDKEKPTLIKRMKNLFTPEKSNKK